MERPEQVLGTAAKRDSIEPLTERQEHQDDPGLDAIEIDPSEISDDGFVPWRPKKYGYLLIVGAIMILILLVLGVRAGAMNWYEMTVMTAFMLFVLLVGFKLIRKEPTQSAGRSERRPSNLDD